MALLNAYALAPGHDNVAGLVKIREIISGQAPDSHPSGVGTLEAAREFIGLDGIAQDDGEDMWEWTFASLLGSEIETIETFIGGRSVNVTVESKNRYGTAFLQWNAVLTLPKALPRQGVKFGNVVFTFVGGVLIP